jgi:CHAD domain-containing protein
VISPRPWLEHLLDHVPIARLGNDVEGVHQVRVATRRLDAWLRLGGRRVLRDDLRWLRRVAGDVRDLDVLLGRHPDGALGTWLRARRDSAQRAFVRALESPRWHGLSTAFLLLPPLDPDVAARGLARIEKRVGRADANLGDDGDRDEASLERWHALRRALRRLRYALEWLDRDAEAIEELQDELGELGDLALARRVFAHHPDESVVRDHLARSEGAFDEAFSKARRGWRSRRSTVLEGPSWNSS